MPMAVLDHDLGSKFIPKIILVVQRHIGIIVRKNRNTSWQMRMDFFKVYGKFKTYTCRIDIIVRIKSKTLEKSCDKNNSTDFYIVRQSFQIACDSFTSHAMADKICILIWYSNGLCKCRYPYLHARLVRIRHLRNVNLI